MGWAANYLSMLSGSKQTPSRPAVERYLISRSTTASTPRRSRLGSLPRPAPTWGLRRRRARRPVRPAARRCTQRALDSLDAIGTPENARPAADAQRPTASGSWASATRSTAARTPLRAAARDGRGAGRPARRAGRRRESAIDDALDAARPDRPCGPTSSSTPASSCRVRHPPRDVHAHLRRRPRDGWTAHVLEQARDRKIIRPARYAGPPLRSRSRPWRRRWFRAAPAYAAWGPPTPEPLG